MSDTPTRPAPVVEPSAEDATFDAFRRVTAYWAPEWVESPEHVSKMFDTMLVALRSEPLDYEGAEWIARNFLSGVPLLEQRAAAEELARAYLALRSEPRPQPTSEELREKLDELKNLRGTAFDAARAAVERLFASSQGYVPTAEDVKRITTLVQAFEKVADEYPEGVAYLRSFRDRLEAGMTQGRTYTRDDVLRIATAAATMHHGYPSKGWPAADAALMAIEAERSPKEEGDG